MKNGGKIRFAPRSVDPAAYMYTLHTCRSSSSVPFVLVRFDILGSDGFSRACARDEIAAAATRGERDRPTSETNLINARFTAISTETLY